MSRRPCRQVQDSSVSSFLWRPSCQWDWSTGPGAQHVRNTCLKNDLGLQLDMIFEYYQNPLLKIHLKYPRAGWNIHDFGTRHTGWYLSTGTIGQRPVSLQRLAELVHCFGAPEIVAVNGSTECGCKIQPEMHSDTWTYTWDHWRCLAGISKHPTV